MTLLISVLEQGLIYAIMALGIYITYKILDFPDLTVDGSFPMGAAITALMISRDMNPLLTLPVSFLLGVVSGICTGVIHVKLKVRDLLSGIIMVNALVPEPLRQYETVWIILIITLIAKYILDWYLRTKSGYILRAVGDNDAIVTAMAVDKGMIKIIGLAIANGLVSLSGCIFAQQQRYFDASMGTGTMVIGLASVIIGTSLFKKITLLRVTSSVVIGSVIYKACVAIAIKFGFQSTDLKLITAVLFLIILVLGRERKRKVKADA